MQFPEEYLVRTPGEVRIVRQQNETRPEIFVPSDEVQPTSPPNASAVGRVEGYKITSVLQCRP